MKPLQIVLTSLLGILLYSCNGNQSKHREQDVFRYNEHSNIASLDPAFARNAATIWATNQLFNGLVQLDDSLQVQPDIAKSWQYNDNTFTYRFTLREDVYFHKHEQFGKDSTRTVTAADFVYSFNRLKDPNVASPGSWVLQEVESYYAENDTTFVVQLKEPFPAFLGLLSMRYCSVVPEEIVTHPGSSFRSKPIGTGPFYFKLWEENIKLVFRKNNHYFEKNKQGEQLPHLEAVAITFLPDKQSEFLQFMQGKLDFISGLDASYKDELLTAEGKLKENHRNTITMKKGPYLNTEFIALQTQSENPVLRSLLARKAINYAVDRKKMITYLRNGIGIPAESGIIPSGLPGFLPEAGYSYQPEKAKALLQEYMKTSGDTNPSITFTTESNYQDIYEYLQRELQKVGFDVSIDIMPASAIRQARVDGSLDAFRSSWIADYPDAENYLSLFYSQNTTPNGPNYTFYNNKTYDSLYNHSKTLQELKDRSPVYATMDSLMLQDAPIVPLFYDEAVRFAHKNVKGLGMNPQNFLILKHVKKEK